MRIMYTHKYAVISITVSKTTYIACIIHHCSLKSHGASWRELVLLLPIHCTLWIHSHPYTKEPIKSELMQNL